MTSRSRAPSSGRRDRYGPVVSRWTRPLCPRADVWSDVVLALWLLALGVAWLVFRGNVLWGVNSLLLAAAFAIKAGRTWRGLRLVDHATRGEEPTRA